MISPVVKGVYVCDEVLTDPVSGKVSLLNSFITMRPPDGFPFELAKLSVFIGLRGARGQARLRVEIVQAATNVTVFRTPDRPVNFFDPLVTVYARFRLEQLRFAEPGRYTVEVFSDGDFLDDEVITVLPVPEQ